MPFSTNDINEIFPNASVMDGDLIIPSGDINSYIPVSETNPGVNEMVFGLVDTMANAIASAQPTNVSVTETQTLSGDTLVKRYVFTINLDMSQTDIDALLNVKAEPTTTTTTTTTTVAP